MNDGYHSTAILAANSELLRTLISALVVLEPLPVPSPATGITITPGIQMAPA